MNYLTRNWGDRVSFLVEGTGNLTILSSRWKYTVIVLRHQLVLLKPEVSSQEDRPNWAETMEIS